MIPAVDALRRLHNVDDEVTEYVTYRTVQRAHREDVLVKIQKTKNYDRQILATVKTYVSILIIKNCIMSAC